MSVMQPPEQKNITMYLKGDHGMLIQDEASTLRTQSFEVMCDVEAQQEPGLGFELFAGVAITFYAENGELIATSTAEKNINPYARNSYSILTVLLGTCIDQIGVQTYVSSTQSGEISISSLRKYKIERK